MIGAENVHFQSSDVQAGDPEKLKYLHSGRHGYPKWEGKIRSQVAKVDERACPGCMFPDAPEGKWPHTYDQRCKFEMKPIKPMGLVSLRSDGSVA
jgi:hypothetical protein